MEHQHRHSHSSGNNKKKNAKQNITPEQYMARMDFYRKRYEDEKKEKEAKEQEKDKELGATTSNTPVSKQTPDVKPTHSPETQKTETTQTKTETPKEVISPSVPKDDTQKKQQNAPTTQQHEDSNTTPEKIKQEEKELGIEAKDTSKQDKAPETETKETQTPTGKGKIELPEAKEKTSNPDKQETKQGTEKNNTPQNKTEQQSLEIKTSPEKSPSGPSAKTLPGGDKAGNKQAAGKGGAGGGDGKRITLIPRPAFDGSEKELAAKVDNEKGQPKAKMLKASEPALKKNKERVNKTQKAEKKKTPVVKKLKEAQDAEVIPQKAADTEKAADGVKDLSKKEDKKADKEGVRQEAKKALKEIRTPQSVDDLKNEGLMANLAKNIDKLTASVAEVVSNKTQEVGADYQEIDNPGLGEKPRAAKNLPDLEKTQETALMDIGEMKSLQKVPDEQLETIKKASEDADKVLKKEKIGEGEAISFEQLSEASDEDLRRGVTGYNKVQEESGSGVDEVKKTEQSKHDAMEKAIKNKEQAKRSHMRANRDEQLKASRGQQGRAKSEFEAKRAEITAKMDEVYKRTRKAVTERLTKIDGEVKTRFAKVKAKAMAKFTRNVEARLDKFHDDRYHHEGQGVWERMGNIWDSWFEDTSNLPEVLAIFDKAKAEFIADIDAGIAIIVTYVESEVAACKKMIEDANTELENIVAVQGPAFKKVAEEAYKKMRKQLDKLDSEVDKKATELKKYLEDQRKKAIEEVDKKIAEIKERLKGALHQLAKFLTDAAYKFFKGVLAASGFSTEQIDKIINQGIEVLTKIVTDPMGFFQNVIEAVGQGFNNFVGNIGKHLKNGFFAWLTGAMAGVGLNLPQKWDLKGIFSVVLQVMGLNWTVIRVRIAKEVGEENLARAEEAGGAGLELLQQIKEKGFVDAVWDMLVEKAGEIQAMVISEIQNWLIVSVVKQAVIKILSMLNPAGAIVQAILAIYDFAMWLINNWERIVQIIQNIVSSIGKIAMGQLGDAAKFIENTLANFVPLLLDFLARLLRLGNVSEKIKKILARVRKPIDDLLAKIMTFIKNKIKGFGKKGKKKKETKDQTKRDMKKDKGKKGVTDADRKKHKQIGEEIKEKLTQPVDKNIKSFDEFYKHKVRLARKLEKQYQRQLKKGIRVKISFGNLEKEKRDGDIDFKIDISPNNFLTTVEAFFRRLNAGEGVYVLDKDNIRKLNADETGFDGQRVGFQKVVNNLRLTLIAHQAEYNLIKDSRLLKTAISRDNGFRKLYTESQDPLKFLIDVAKVLKIKKNDQGIVVAPKFRKSGEEAVKKLLENFYRIQGIRDAFQQNRAPNIAQAQYEKIQKALDNLPAYANIGSSGARRRGAPNTIKPALAIAYHKSGSYELGINKNVNNSTYPINPKVKSAIDKIQTEFTKALKKHHTGLTQEDQTSYLKSILGRDVIGQHAEVKAVSNLLTTLVDNGTITDLTKFNMREIVVAVIKTQGNGQIGYEFIRCPNCTLVLNALGVTPVTDDSSFLENGQPVTNKIPAYNQSYLNNIKNNI